jgi:hypothetical protein
LWGFDWENLACSRGQGEFGMKFRRLPSSCFKRMTLAVVALMFCLVTAREAAVIGHNGASLWITTGPDGNLWIADYANNQIGRVTTGGVATFFPTPTTAGFVALAHWRGQLLLLLPAILRLFVQTMILCEPHIFQAFW